MGLRLLGLWTTVAVRRRLPRLVRSDLLTLLGTPDLNERPIDATKLADAVSAALALPNLQAPLPGEARRAAVLAAGDMLNASELAQILGCSARTVRRLRHTETNPALGNAITSQLRLRSYRPPPTAFTD